jgi:Xaa-Pro dipeptidase
VWRSMRRSWSNSVSIEASEFRERVRRFAGRLKSLDIDAALVVSRGGGTFDRYANVFYLCGHYQPYAYLPETPGLFSGRSHTALIVAASGETILCVSAPEVVCDISVVNDVRFGDEFTKTVADACRDVGADPARLGIVGADVLPASMWVRLQELFGFGTLYDLEEELAALRRVKSPAEQDLTRAAATTGRRAVSAFLDSVRPGSTEAEAVGAALEVVACAGAATYFAAVSSGPRSDLYTATPLPGFGLRSLEPGDLVRFDLGIVREGYLCDFGRTTVVGDPSPDQARLLETLTSALDCVIEAIGPGVPVSEIVQKGDKELEASGVIGQPVSATGVMFATYPAHWGHGLGLGWERPWLVQSEPLCLQPGMVLAVERAITLSGVGTAAAEQNLLVTDDGTELLTEGPGGRWT